jgi:hypothetical protein
MQTDDFKLGDEVEWESQAGGTRKYKCGRICGIITPGLHPIHVTNTGMPRGHTSYEVEVCDDNGKKRYYWPKVSLLRRPQKMQPQDVPCKVRETTYSVNGMGRAGEPIPEKISTLAVVQQTLDGWADFSTSRGVTSLNFEKLFGVRLPQRFSRVQITVTVYEKLDEFLLSET